MQELLKPIRNESLKEILHINLTNWLTVKGKAGYGPVRSVHFKLTQRLAHCPLVGDHPRNPAV